MKIKKKTDWCLNVGRAYVYRIFENGNNEMTIEVQRREDFENISLDGTAMRTFTKEVFNKLTVEYINKIFEILRKEAATA